MTRWCMVAAGSWRERRELHTPEEGVVKVDSHNSHKGW